MNYSFHEILTLITLKIIIIIITVICVINLDCIQCTKIGEKDNGFTNSSINDGITKMINPGDRLHIPCSVGLTPGGSIQWVQNGNPILLDFSATQRRHWNISNDGSTALTINRVTKIDEGVWECWELDTQGKVKQKAHVMRLVVTNIPEDPYIEFEGTRLSDDSTITVRENTVINVNCVVRGASPPVRRILWFLSHLNITHESKLLMEYSAEEDISLAISVLTVNVTQDYHKRLLICQVFHVSWVNPAIVSASFNILYVPAFSITREPGFGYPILEGMAVSLRCEIDANPLSPVQWHRDADNSQPNTSLPQIETNSDGTITFSHISKLDTGWYKCQTHHQFGYFASFGYYLNVRNPSELQDMEHILRSPIAPALSADAMDSEPNEAALMKSHEASKESFEASISSATNPLNSGSNHRYSERNTPVLGKECKGNHINSGEPVIDFINRTVIAVIGTQISLAARFCCYPRPKKVFWIHRHLAIMPQRVVGSYSTRELIMSSDSMNCFTSTFDIHEVKPEDSGDVLFIVMNPKGIDKALLTINVTISSHSVSRGSSLVIGLNGDTQYLYHFLLLTIMSITSLMWQTLMSVPVMDTQIVNRGLMKGIALS